MSDHIAEVSKLVADNPGVSGLPQLGRNAIERVTELERELAAVTEERELFRQMIAEQREHLDKISARLAAIDNAPTVAWLCTRHDESGADATCREAARDDYARFGRAIQELIARPAKEAM